MKRFLLFLNLFLGVLLVWSLVAMWNLMETITRPPPEDAIGNLRKQVNYFNEYFPLLEDAHFKLEEKYNKDFEEITHVLNSHTIALQFLLQVPEGFLEDTKPPSPDLSEKTPKYILSVRIAAEERCSRYSELDYTFPQSTESAIVTKLDGRIYSPYTGQFFQDTSETEIDHIVARSEAHDSGLCGASPETRKAFASDLDNLTLTSSRLSRNSKRAYDLAEWLPIVNVCWYVDTVVEVKKKYNLTMDLAEARMAEKVLSVCISTDMLIPD